MYVYISKNYYQGTTPPSTGGVVPCYYLSLSSLEDWVGARDHKSMKVFFITWDNRPIILWTWEKCCKNSSWLALVAQRYVGNLDLNDTVSTSTTHQIILPFEHTKDFKPLN